MNIFTNIITFIKHKHSGMKKTVVVLRQRMNFNLYANFKISTLKLINIKKVLHKLKNRTMKHPIIFVVILDMVMILMKMTQLIMLILKIMIMCLIILL